MQALVTYFVLLMPVIILSSIQPRSPILVNARKLPTNNAIFSVDLIRRNSTTTTLGSISHHHQITLSSTFYDTKKVLQPELIWSGGDYAVKISIGTPPIEFTAFADTGSDLVWVQCSPCQHCLPQQYPLFDPTRSSTNNKIACTSQICNSNHPGLWDTCCTNDNLCNYVVEYEDGLQSSGVLNTETITFPSSKTSFTNFKFGCGYYQEGYLGPSVDGILGLGGGPLSLVSQLGPKINYKFSYCLTSPSSGVNSKLNFGVDVMGPGVVSTPFAKQDTFRTYYYLTLNSISIADTSVRVSDYIIIDSGTTLTFLPSSVYDGVMTAVKANIGLSPVANRTQKYDQLCYEVGSMGEIGFNPPYVVFNFNGGNVVLKEENTFSTFNGLTCFTMVPSDDVYIFGNIAQLNFHIGYDLKANQVSFAPTDCSKF